MSGLIINEVMAFYSSFVPCVTKPSESYGVREWENFFVPWRSYSHDILFQLNCTIKKKKSSLSGHFQDSGTYFLHNSVT